MIANASNYQEAFKNLYQDMGIYEVPLHERCLKSSECWRGGKERYPEGEKSFIAAPWVGGRYRDVGLLFLGKNLNEFGGFGAIQCCVKDARSKVERNKANIYLWAPILGGLILDGLSKMHMAREDTDYRKIPQQTIQTAYDYMAFTNLIKCSPVGNRSTEVTENMWPNCASHILSKELSILKPKYIVCLNIDGLRYLLNSALGEYTFKETTKDNWFHVFENQSGGFAKWVVGSYHPSYMEYLRFVSKIIEGFRTFPFKF